MSRLSRTVVPRVPHHVVQRGTRRARVFLREEDHDLYRELLRAQCEREGVEVRGYTLMPNHSHLVAVPQAEESLRRAIGEAHRRYAWRINRREGWTGHLWQERFFSCPMDDLYTWRTMRYVAHNPVRAGLVEKVEDWPWGSARALLGLEEDPLVTPDPRIDWGLVLRADASAEDRELIRKRTHSGYVLGGESFVKRLEQRLRRRLRPRRPGPKRRRLRSAS